MPMGANEGLHGVADYVKFVVLKLFVFTTYIVSHIYDVRSSFQVSSFLAFVKKLFFFQYVTYPIYFIYYSPWLVRQYKREDHARREDRDDCIIFHSLQTPTAANVTLERNGLDTMDKIFDYVSSCCLFFFVSPPSNLIISKRSAKPMGKVMLWAPAKSLPKKMRCKAMAKCLKSLYWESTTGEHLRISMTKQRSCHKDYDISG